MIIKKIKIVNFKSFKNVEIDLSSFNVVIGANASGKSNFIQVLKFLRDIVQSGTSNAIALQGDVEFLYNTKLGYKRDLVIDVIFEERMTFRRDLRDLALAMECIEGQLHFEIGFNARGSAFFVKKDFLRLKVEFVEVRTETGKKLKKSRKIGSGEIKLIRENDRVKSIVKTPRELDGVKRVLFPDLRQMVELEKNDLLIEIPFPLFAWPRVIFSFEDISLYDFDPKLSKKTVPSVGKLDLEENGSNLVLVIKNILENRENKGKFINLINDILPFVNDFQVDKFAGKALMAKLKESFTPDHYFPSFLLSDGTINVTALITALYFGHKDLLVFEEPDRNLHPYIIKKIIEMMKEVSARRQIIISTHNPEIVKYAGIENLILISRDRNGYSSILRPSENDQVKIFLENEMGLDELFTQNLLGG